MTFYFTRPLSQLTTRWRIFLEESAALNPREEHTDFEELRGRGDTRIYRHGQLTLAVSTERPRLYARLSRLPGLTPKTGCVLLFPEALLDTVAAAIHARHRHHLTPDQRHRAAHRLVLARLMKKKPDSERLPASKTDDPPSP